MPTPELAELLDRLRRVANTPWWERGPGFAMPAAAAIEIVVARRDIGTLRELVDRVVAMAAAEHPAVDGPAEGVSVCRKLESVVAREIYERCLGRSA